MSESTNKWDRLVAATAKRACTPNRATTAGAVIDIAPQPVSIEAFEEEERRLGISFPLLLKRLYTEVGNGGFGPGHGLLSLLPLSDADHPISFYYLTFREARNRKQADWMQGVVPISDWGDLILSCVDLSDRSADPPVVRFEPNMPKVDTLRYLNGAPFRGAGLIPERDTLSSWFEDWIVAKEMFRRPYRE